MTSSLMSSSKSSTIAPATRSNTRQIKALVEPHIKTSATTRMDNRQDNRRHITMIDRRETLVEAMDSSPTKNGAERRKMTANTTISTKTPAMNIRMEQNVTSLMAPHMVSTRLAHSSTTSKPRVSHLPLISNLHLRAAV